MAAEGSAAKTKFERSLGLGKRCHPAWSRPHFARCLEKTNKSQTCSARHLVSFPDRFHCFQPSIIKLQLEQKGFLWCAGSRFEPNKKQNKDQQHLKIHHSQKCCLPCASPPQEKVVLLIMFFCTALVGLLAMPPLRLLYRLGGLGSGRVMFLGVPLKKIPLSPMCFCHEQPVGHG